MAHVWRSRTYQKFLFSFLLLLILLALGFSVMLRGMALSSAENDLRLSSAASAKQSAFYVNQIMTNMDTIASTIGTSSNIINYHIATQVSARQDLIKSLRQYQSFNGMIQNVFYIPLRSPYLVSGNSTYTLETFSKLFQRKNMTPERLNALMAEDNSKFLALYDEVNDTILGNGLTKHVVSVFYPLPTGGIGKYALLLFDIDAEKLADMLEVYTPDGYTYLLDDSGALLNGSDQLTLSQTQITDIAAQLGSEEFGEIVLDDGAYYVSVTQLLHNWRFFYLIPRGLLVREVELRQAQFLLFFGGVTGLGFLVAFILSLWNYRPIARLSRNLKMSNDAGSQPNELRNIELGVRNMVARSSMLEARLEDSRPAVISQHLLNLINNRYTRDDFYHIQEDGLSFRHTNFVVALFAPRNAEIIRKDGGWVAHLQECVPDQWDAYFVEYHPSRLYIGLLALPKVPMQTLYEQMDVVQQALPSPAAISISRQTDELFNLAPSFIQAQIALQQRFFSGYNHVYYYDDSVKTTVDYPYTHLNKINLELNDKNETACQREMNDLFSYMQSSNLSLETIYCICFEILGELMRRLVHSSIPFDHIEGLLPDIVQVTRSETLEEIQQVMNEALETSFDALKSPNDAMSSLPDLQEIFAFVKQNGFNSDFSVQVIAEHFKVSYPYLGKYFKNMTGSTLNKYLQEQRIAQARRLLITTALNLSEIVEQVGYIDLSSFIKLFRQTTGMTPIAYRKLYQ